MKFKQAKRAMKFLTILLCLILLILIAMESIPYKKIENTPIKIRMNSNGMIYGDFYGYVFIIC